MSQTKCLVVGSCTGQKDDAGCPEEIRLQKDDFNSPSSLSKAEGAAKNWLRPAGEMYKGRQHTLMMDGVRRLRNSFSKASFDVSIVSAGYGLVSEDKAIAPYNITFKGKGVTWVREQGALLKIPEALSLLIPQYEVVFFLLGKEYLTSIGKPPVPARGQKYVYFGTGVERNSSESDRMMAIPAAQKEATHYKGAGVTAIKGRMFDLFAQGMTHNPDRWQSFLKDTTTRTIVDVMNEAREANL
jgi:hypothetical protein